MLLPSGGTQTYQGVRLHFILATCLLLHQVILYVHKKSLQCSTKQLQKKKTSFELLCRQSYAVGW